ncbi:uncharacterized protein LOC126272995 [Schistocerca gregaria]|uniref:uncharacterized protein LOC126272995 n=1 Tax=Schistocerca gregaria TaxID=7010 RepID=UPI00211F325E|nr:uncharacterized protein LOC126272995 [Schistocerca gregaria]
MLPPSLPTIQLLMVSFVLSREISGHFLPAEEGLARGAAVAASPAAPAAHAAPGALDNSTSADVWGRAPRSPCSCADGQCGCCTGFLLSQLNINLRQRGCVNVTYDPDDFAMNMALYFNDRVLYSNTVSGKNPRPVCVSVPRLPILQMCVRFSNVYLAGRNIHACVSLLARWDGDQVFRRDLDCVRLGADGVAVVTPEQGGGLPLGSTGGGDDEDVDDYDDPEDPDAQSAAADGDDDDDDDDDEDDDDDGDDDDDDDDSIL